MSPSGDGIAAEIQEIFVLKCQLASSIYNVALKDTFFEAKEAKRETLLELIEFFDGEKGATSNASGNGT